MSESVWTPERDQILRDRWNVGAKCSEIARLLNCSKNSIVGRARRLDLTRRESPIIRNGEGRKPRHLPALKTSTLPALLAASETASLIIKPMPVSPPSPVPVSSMVRSGKCQFPLWNDATPKPARTFCGCRVRRSDSVYCETHRAICYVQQPRTASARP